MDEQNQGDAQQEEQDSKEQEEQDSKEQEEQDPKEQMKQIEEDPPASLDDWPQGKAKYETFGGPEGEHGYHEGPEEKLGPSSVRHHEGGEVSVEGEQVDNPEEYKGDPIPGGPTDPSAPGVEGDTEDEGSGA